MASLKKPLKNLLPLFVLFISLYSLTGLHAVSATPSIKHRDQGINLNSLNHKETKAVSALVDVYKKRLLNSDLASQGRLTLSSGSAIPGNVSAATTVYFTPYNGDKIALYSGSLWQLISFTEVSVAVPSTTTTNFDIFGYNNAGTLTLETVNWTDDTTRATALTTQDGIYVKTGATTRRYLGTGRTTGTSGQSEDSATNRYLWNMHNRVPRQLAITDNTSHSYNTNTTRQYRATSTNQIDVVVGQTGVQIVLNAGGYATNDTGAVVHRYGIGVDSTTVKSNFGIGGDLIMAGVTYGGVVVYTDFVALGRHTYPLQQLSNTTGTTTWSAGYLWGVIDGT